MHSFLPFKQNLIWPCFCVPFKDKQGIIKKKKKKSCLGISQIQLCECDIHSYLHPIKSRLYLPYTVLKAFCCVELN